MRKNPKEKPKKHEDFNKSIDERQSLEYTDGYTEAKSIREARANIEKFGITTDDSYNRLPLEVANHYNCELTRVFNVINTVGWIDKIVVDSPKIEEGVDLAYDWREHALLIRSSFRERPTEIRRSRTNPDGSPKIYQWSTGSSRHPYRHEIGHAIYHLFIGHVDSGAEKRAKKLYDEFFGNPGDSNSEGVVRLSKYANKDCSEMFAEAFASVMDNIEGSSFARRIVNYVLYGEDDDTKRGFGGIQDVRHPSQEG